MRIGTVLSIPAADSKFATARDEYGNNRTVYTSELPEGAEVGDEYAYRVDFMTGGAATLKNDE